MPISDQLRKRYSPQQLRQLKILADELKRRGIDIPSEIKRTKLRWPLDSRGFFTKNDSRFYEPSINQSGFVFSNARFSAFIGSRGSGKSAAGAQKALIKISKGEDGVVGNPDFENFKTSTWPEFRQWIPWEMVVISQRYRQEESWSPHQPFTMVFVNGAKVICKGIKDPDSARGPNVNWFWFDEAQRDRTGESWKIAVASVRVGKDPQSWATATPAGKAHWLYTFFVEENIPAEVVKILKEKNFEGKLIEWFHGTLDENKNHLDDMFLASLLMAYSDDSYLEKQEVRGLFVTPEGAIGDRHWFDNKILKEVPDVNIDARVRYWDLAASEKKISTHRRVKKDPDETVGTLESWDAENFYIEDQVAGRWLYDNILDTMHRTAIKDGPLVPIYVEEEPGSGGKNQVAAIQKFFREGDKDHRPLPQWKVEGERPEGDKVMRANIWFAEAKAGRVYLIEGDWNEPFLDQVDCFADCIYDDRIDSVSGARKKVAPIISWKNVEFMKL